MGREQSVQTDAETDGDDVSEIAVLANCKPPVQLQIDLVCYPFTNEDAPGRGEIIHLFRQRVLGENTVSSGFGLDAFLLKETGFVGVEFHKERTD